MRFSFFYLSSFLVIQMACAEKASCQFTDSIFSFKKKHIDKLTSESNRKLNFLERRISKSNDWVLKKIHREEQKLQRKLSKIDSSKAAGIVGKAAGVLNKADAQLASVESRAQSLAVQFPGVDELSTSLSFFGTVRNNTALLQQRLQRFNELKTKLAGVQSEMQRAELIQQYLRERKQQLREQLNGLNASRHLGRINKHAGTYSRLITDYKNALNNPARMQQLVLEKLKRLPAFNNFFASNSALGSLLPGAGAFDPAQLAGMQTQALTSQLVQNTVNSGGPNAGAFVTQQIQQAQGTLNNLLNRLPGSGSTLEMPNYQEQSMRSKSFFQRLEFGANLQFARANGFIPQTGNWAAQVAYKFSKKGSAGIGAAYSMGLGNGINDIRVSHNGFGLRSFADFKLKGNFFINGGFEQNYNAAFNRIADLNNLNRWNGSALLGLSKKYNVSKKLRGNIQLLYDFMHRSMVPNTQAVLFRFGYNF